MTEQSVSQPQNSPKQINVYNHATLHDNRALRAYRLYKIRHQLVHEGLAPGEYIKVSGDWGVKDEQGYNGDLEAVVRTEKFLALTNKGLEVAHNTSYGNGGIKLYSEITFHGTPSLTACVHAAKSTSVDVIKIKIDVRGLEVHDPVIAKLSTLKGKPMELGDPMVTSGSADAITKLMRQAAELLTARKNGIVLTREQRKTVVYGTEAMRRVLNRPSKNPEGRFAVESTKYLKNEAAEQGLEVLHDTTRSLYGSV